jgi:hypothetical protein
MNLLCLCSQEKKEKFDQEQLLMNLKQLVLVLWPMAGPAGWDAYRDLAAKHEKEPGSISSVVQYTATIAITYEPFRQALLSSQQGPPSFTEPRSIGMSRGNTTGQLLPPGIHDIRAAFNTMNGKKM